MLFCFEDALFQSPGPGPGAAANFLPSVFLGEARVFAVFLDEAEETKPGSAAIDGLGAGVLNSDAEAGGGVAKSDCGGDFVHMLSARATAAGELFLEVFFAKIQGLKAGEFESLEIGRHGS